MSRKGRKKEPVREDLVQLFLALLDPKRADAAMCTLGAAYVPDNVVEFPRKRGAHRD